MKHEQWNNFNPIFRKPNAKTCNYVSFKSSHEYLLSSHHMSETFNLYFLRQINSDYNCK